MYFYPHLDPNDKEALPKVTKHLAEGYVVFASISPKGKYSMPVCLMFQFVFNFAGALLVTFLLSKLSHDGTGCRVGVTVFFALFALVTSVLPNWTWWGFSNGFIGFLIFDHLVG